MSPNLISATLTVSFSLMIGRQPHSNSVQDGVADVEVAGPAVEVAGGEQDLGGVDAVRREAFLVGPHQEALADGGTGLEVRQVGRPLAEAEPADAGADGPGADQGDLAAGGADALELVGQGLDAAPVERAVGVGQHVGADLDDHRAGPGENLGSDDVGHEAIVARRKEPEA